jgi:uncharacterized spore protein YtfJ
VIDIVFLLGAGVDDGDEEREEEDDEERGEGGAQGFGCKMVAIVAVSRDAVG